MTLHITPDMMEASYELLRTTLPFRRWGLPSGEEVAFSVTNSKETAGTHRFGSGRHAIECSCRLIGTLDILNRTMAHEMVHVRDHLIGAKAGHGNSFQNLATSVCRHHSFDRRFF